MFAAVRPPPPAVDTAASIFVAKTLPIVPALVSVDVATFHISDAEILLSDEISAERLVKRIPEVVDADCICVESDDEADIRLVLTAVI
jgi:hypothetical protein